MNRTRTRFPMAVAACLFSVLALAASGCSNDDDSNPDAPDGWKGFNEGAWSGAAPSDWTVSRVNSADVLSPSDFEDLPGLSQASLDEMFSSGGLSEFVVVFLDDNKTFATNINMIGCFSDAESAPEGREVEAYESGGTRATLNSRTEFNGKEWNLVQAFLGSSYDTYQIFPRDGSCNLVITLSTRPGDTSKIADFKQFLGLLEVDTTKLDR